MEEACVPNVIYDLRDPDPDRRYKMLYWDFSIPRPARAASASVAFSPDGIRWTPFEGNPILTGTGDTHSLLGWDDSVGKYVAYVRPGRGAVQGLYRRLIGRSVSDDFTTWSEPEVVLAPDEDEPDLEFYNMPVFKYEGLYLGLPWGYYTYAEEPRSRAGGLMDVQLAVSRDGVEWSRAGDRQSFIPTGPRGSLDQGMVACAKEPVRVGDELWLYGSGSDGGPREQAQERAGLSEQAAPRRFRIPGRGAPRPDGRLRSRSSARAELWRSMRTPGAARWR